MARTAAITFVLFICFVAASQALFSETVYTASLSPGNVVDQPVVQGNINSFGTAFCRLLRNNAAKSIHCEVQHNVDELLEANVALGAAGELGTTLFSFPTNQGFHLSDTFDLSSVDGFTQDDLEESFLNGLFYFNFVTLDYGRGEIRGQLLHTDRFYASMSSTQTVPHASGTSAQGISVGTYDQIDNVLSFRLVHNVNNPTDTEIGIGLPGDVGSLQGFVDGESPLAATVSTTPREDENIFLDLVYLQVTSESSPNGEIRGQLVSIDYLVQPSFTAVLDGEQAGSGSTASGVAVVVYDCKTRLMEYLVIHDIQNPIDGFVSVGGQGDSAQALFAMETGVSPAFGQQILLPSEAQFLFDGNLSFIVNGDTGDSQIGGSIRGQINTEFSFAAYISGTNVVPPVTTSAVGLMLLRTVDEDNTLEYIIHHESNSDSVSEIALRLGAEGQNGGKIFEFPAVGSPFLGSFSLSDDQQTALDNGRLYVEIVSVERPLGAARGQVEALGQCDLNVDNTITYASNSRSLQSSEEDFISAALTDEDDFHIIYVRASASSIAPSILLMAAAIVALVF